MTLENFSTKWTPEPFSGCWLWTAASDWRYGHCWHNGKTQKAHRVSWLLHHGAIPAGMHVLHHCDTPSCVNPAHLFLGDHDANMFDMARKGRNGISKITPQQALEIRNSTEPRKVLRERYGLSVNRICEIQKGKAWKAI